MQNSLLTKTTLPLAMMVSFWSPSYWHWHPTPTPPPVMTPAPTPRIACPMIYQPVCGANGVTYGNRCEAEVLNHVPVAYPGACVQANNPSPRWPGLPRPTLPPGPVPTFPLPTVPPSFPGFNWPLDGILPSPSRVENDPNYPLTYCPPENNPVCGVNGITYESRCVAEKMNHAPIAYAGACSNTPRSTISNQVYTNTVPEHPYGTFCSPHIPVCIPTLQSG